MEGDKYIMKFKKSCIIFVVLILFFILMYGLLLVNKPKVDTISYENDMVTVNLKNEDFYNVSLYGVDTKIYSKSDYERLKNIGIDTDISTIRKYYFVYFTDKPIIKNFLKEKVIERELFNNNVCFIISNDTQLLVKKDISLPKICKDNISKIVITSISNEDILFATENEIAEFLNNYNYYFENYDDELKGYECRIYYKNTSSDIFETIKTQGDNYNALKTQGDG